jgi:hypothetical protein
VLCDGIGNMLWREVLEKQMPRFVVVGVKLTEIRFFVSTT